MLKKSITRRNSLWWFLALVTLLLSALMTVQQWKTPSIEQATFHVHNTEKSVELPYKEAGSDKIKRFFVSVPVVFSRGESTEFAVIPDDCLKRMEVNGKKVSLSRINDAALCDYRRGFHIDLHDYLKPGNNDVTFLIEDRGGSRALSFARVSSFFENTALQILWFLWGGMVGYLVARRLGFSVALSGLSGVALAVRIIYLLHTSWDLRTYDVEGHLWYLKNIAETMAIPSSQACWVCYHPPLYYMLSGMVYEFFSLISSSAARTGVQFFSLALNFGFIIFVLMILRRLVTNAQTLFFLSALVLFFPSLIIHAPRIGNDVLMYFAFGAAFYFYILWIQTKRGLMPMLVFSVVALFAKMNGVLIMGIIGIAYLIRTIMFRRVWVSIKPMAMISAVFILAVVAYLLVQHVRGAEGVVGNSGGLNSYLFVGNEPVNYLSFDFTSYLKEPFTDPWNDGKGRQYFWNFLLKTSLFGEFSYSGQVVWGLGYTLSVLYLLLIAGVLYGLWRLKNQDVLQAVPFMTAALVLLAGALYLRLSIPAACSNDFRYILPIILPVTYFLGYGLEQLRREGRFVYWVGGAVILVFSLLSGLFVMLV